MATQPATQPAIQQAKKRLTLNDRSGCPEGENSDEAGAFGGLAFKPLTAEEATVFRAQHAVLSPWWVVLAQGVVAVAAALLAGLLTQRMEVLWSLLYGAATVMVPAALMARGLTRKLSNVSLGAGAVSFMLWEAVKVIVSLAMLALATKLVQPLVWLALLLGMVLCMKVYWLALLWRGCGKSVDPRVESRSGQHASIN